MKWLKVHYKLLLVCIAICAFFSFIIINENKIEYWKWRLSSSNEEIEAIYALNDEYFDGKGEIKKGIITRFYDLHDYGLSIKNYDVAKIHYIKIDDEDIWIAKITNYVITNKGKSNENWKSFIYWVKKDSTIKGYQWRTIEDFE